MLVAEIEAEKVSDTFFRDEPPCDSPSPSMPVNPDGLRALAQHLNEFAVALYGELRHEAGNVFFSPFSISTLLAIALAGARGQTAAEMTGALRVPPVRETLHVTLAQMIQRFNAAAGGKYGRAVSNSLWSHEKTPLLAEYRELVARHYADNVNLVDFTRNAEETRRTINRWVEDQTKQKIQELIPPGALDASTRLVLVNAVYFKGMWRLPFSECDTLEEEPFYLDDGTQVRSSLMYQQAGFRYLQADGFQAVDLDYRGTDLSMLVLLPGKQTRLGALESQLSAEMLRNCLGALRKGEVQIYLPRFKMTWGTMNLVAQLSALGMPLAFTRFEADFSGINGLEPPDEESLFLSAVLHQAFVEVNEEGTEAAAASGVVILGATAPELEEPSPIPIFRADHPFLFAIHDRSSGAVLFLGRVTDPTRES